MACKVTYKGKTYDFGRKNVTTSHKDHLSGGSVSGDYTIYTYGDDMSYSIGGNTKMLTAPGTIKVKVAEPEPTVTSEGFENASQIVTDSLVKWKIDYVKKWSNGKEDRNSFACNAMRSLHPTTNWTSEEANSNQSTGSASASVTGSAAQSKSVNGATFSWTKETRSIKSVAKLAGSNQNNGWEAVDPVGCSVTYNGKTYNFDRLSISMSNNATVSGGNENGGYKVYNYRDKLAYTYGSNTKYSQAPGTIKVKVTTVEPPFFPAEWGELVDAKQTNANTESHKGSVYTWSLRFKNGYVLPVVVRPGATRPEWEFSYVEKTSVTTYNGGTYEAASGKWINTTAKDQPDHMIWARSGVERANKNYNIAKNENWDEGRLINGKPSTKTSRYTLTITNGKLSATDTYTGTYMGTWTSYTGN
jgi:YHS domain-containing protein